MGWESLRGQDAALAALRRDLDAGRVAHAYAFSGPAGVGKATAAALFAQALECEGGEPPCGACPPCRKVAVGAHPDVITVRPAAGRRTVGVERIRDEVIRRAHQRPNEGRWQVFIVDDAHLVTVAAFNALLKTLEEPPPDTVLILVTPNLHTLPATVVSRCRRVRFQALGRADQRAILEERLGAGEEEADRLIALSLGRLGVALGAEGGRLAARREAAVAFLEGLSAPPGRADEAALLALAAEQAGGGGTAREAVAGFLEMLRGLLRDILVWQVAPEEAEPWHTDLAGPLSGLGRKWGVRGLIEALDRVETALQDVGVVNTNPALTLEALVFSLRATVSAGV